jgi:putative FmdB family regulatory protein
MPIYEYVCDQCGHHLEALQKISEEPLVYCPECGEAALRKKVSAAAFRLKGTGWYETDFKDGGKEKKGSGEDKSDRGVVPKSANETSESSGDTKSDSKSDSKTETSSDSRAGPNKGEAKPTADSGGSSGAGGSSKPSSGASPGSD